MANPYEPPKRGLCLPGGGAKGAYQFGCLLAFRAANWPAERFDVVCATSVGSINGALWAFDRLDEGERLWNQLSFETTYPPKRKYRGAFAKTYHFAMGALHVVWQAVLFRLKFGIYRGFEPQK